MMETKEKIPATTSASISKRPLSREGLTSQQAIQSSTQDNFYKKVSNSKGFANLNKTEMYGTIIQMMKSDLFQLQEMIKEHSHLTKMFKLLSKSSALSRKLTEIEEGMDIKSITEKMTEDSSNVERIGKIYNCTNTTELIQKISLELSYYELFLKKMTEYFFLLHLKFIGEDNLFQDSFSKILVIKLVVEKLIEKANSVNEMATSSEINVDTGIKTTIELENQTQNINPSDLESKLQEDFASFIQIHSLNDLIEISISNPTGNQIIEHAATLSKEFLNKIDICYSDLIAKYSGKKIEPNYNLQLDNFLTIKLLIEKILLEKDSEIARLRKELQEKSSYDTSTHVSPDFDSEMNKLKIQLNESKEKNRVLEEEIQKLKTTQGSGDYSSPRDMYIPKEVQGEVSPYEILKLVEASTRSLSQVKDEARKKLENELKELTQKYDHLNQEFEILTVENNSLIKKFEALNRTKTYDPESYEQVLLEQFDIMKSSFIEKIEQLNAELSQSKLDSRRKIYELQEDLKETKNLKEIFLYQVIDLQKKLNIF